MSVDVTFDLAVLASAQVTDWPERIALTVAVLASIVAVLALMRWGWVSRRRRQGDVAALPDVPALPAIAHKGPVSARFLGATRSGDWLDRVVARGLGVPSAAQVTVSLQGIWVMRTGAPNVFVAADEVAGVRHDRGIAGRVVEQDGVLVITWRHAGQHLDLGLRVRDTDAAEGLRTTIEKLIVEPSVRPSHSETSRD
ncbi:MAG: hypothetical protein LH630_04415 [Actinomycetia bacterium]|nr:hypothetical protein [Actinomycetes bacterium]